MKTHAVLLFLLFSAASSRSEELCGEVVVLSFGGVRDGAPSNTPPFPSSTGTPCEPENIKILCSNTGYPNDVFCDVGRLKIHSSWQNNTDVVGVQLGYNHPSVQGTYCTAKLTSGAGTETDFTFVGGDCYPVVEDQALPPFLVSDVKVLKITATTLAQGDYGSGDPAASSSTTHAGAFSTTVGYYHGDECFSKIYQFGGARVEGGVKGGVNRASGVVKFDLLYFHCQSPTTTSVGGRTPEKSNFSHDGKRYRPKRM